MSSILFCTPCYGGMVLAPHFRSCMNLKEELVRVGLGHDWLIMWNESLIHRGRMEMVSSFLKTDHTHLFWLDADIEFVPEDVAKVWNMQADIGVGFYPMKKVDSPPLSAWRGGRLVDLKECPAEPFEVDYAGTGFMCIRRGVIERLAADAPVFRGKEGPVPAIMLTPVTDGVLESEDYYFCRKAREAGFKIMGDPSLRLKHWGQYAFGAQ